MKIITTVGTSIFGNCLKSGEDIKTKTDHLDNKGYSDWDNCKNEIDKLRTKINSWANGKNTASAEIASLLKIQEELNDCVEVYLICSETILSRLAAECIQKWFEGNENFDVKEAKIVVGLQVKDRKKFERFGIIKLIDCVSDIAQEGNYWDDCIINVTGGYKATIPILSVIAQIKNRPIRYIFDESESDHYQLLSLSQFPISIDWQILFKFSNNFQELHNGVLDSLEEYKIKNNLPEEFNNYIHEIIEGNESLLGLNGVGYFLSKELENHFFIKVPLGCSIFLEEVTKKKNVELAIKELFRKLSNLSEPFINLHDVNIKHTSINKTWVYKHTQPQIRLQYEWQESTKILTIFNYRFINSDIDDKDPKRGYKPIFENLYSNLKDQEQIIIGFKKYEN